MFTCFNVQKHIIFLILFVLEHSYSPSCLKHCILAPVTLSPPPKKAQFALIVSGYSDTCFCRKMVQNQGEMNNITNQDHMFP